MKRAFDMSSPHDLPARGEPVEIPALGWREALARGRELLAGTGTRYGLSAVHEESLSLNRKSGVYIFRVRGSGDMSKSGGTNVFFDAGTGELKGLAGPGLEPAGPVISRWHYWLHTARVFGLPMQIFVCVMGLVITMLSVTGVYIWWKKRRARKFSASRRSETADAEEVAAE